MLSNAARFVAIFAAASFVAFSSAPAEACSDISDSALDIVSSGISITTGTAPGNGAPFFTLAVRDVFGYTATDIATLWGSSSPNSAKYYDNIVAGTYFTQLTTIGDIDAGDVLAIDAAGTYSGHTAVVRGVPTALATALNPVFSGTTQWALPIADTTGSEHGCSIAYPDSRRVGTCGSGTFTAGPGTAFMRVYSDTATGDLLGYTWSVTSGGTYYSPTTRPYAVGRVTPCPPL